MKQIKVVVKIITIGDVKSSREIFEMVRDYYLKLFSFRNKKTIAFLCENSKIVKQKKKEQLLLSEKSNSLVYILVSGSTRCYTINEDGNDISFKFSYKPGTIFMLGEGSDQSGHYYWESLTDSIYLRLPFDVFYEAFGNDPGFRADVLNNLKHQLNEEVSLRNALITKRAKERYLWFLETYTDFPSYIPQKYIASYLNMLPQTLSEIKGILQE